MTLPGHLKHFPKTHFLGVAALFIFILILSVWPCSKSAAIVGSSLESNFVIEMTELPESTTEQLMLNWESAKVKSGDSLSVLFSRHNIGASEVLDVVNVAPKEAIRLLPGQKLRWVRSDDNKLQHLQIILSPLAHHSFVKSGYPTASTL